MLGDKVWLRVGAPIPPKERAGGQGGVPVSLLPLHQTGDSVRDCHGKTGGRQTGRDRLLSSLT